MFRYILIIIMLILIPVNVQAKYIYEYLEGIEPLLMERKYSEAEIKFNKLDRSIRFYSIRGSFVQYFFKDVIIYLKEDDKVRKILTGANNDPKKYKLEGQYNISKKSCQKNDCNNVGTARLRYKMRVVPESLTIFSKKFAKYINSYHKETIDLFNKTHKHLAELESREKNRIKNEIEAERERKREEQRKKDEPLRLAKEAEKERIKREREDESKRKQEEENKKQKAQRLA